MFVQLSFDVLLKFVWDKQNHFQRIPNQSISLVTKNFILNFWHIGLFGFQFESLGKKPSFLWSQFGDSYR